MLSIYSGDWKPKGEYFFDFETEVEVENWFLSSEGLFINKPEQESEDEYEFYKIDLSRFADKEVKANSLMVDFLKFSL